MPHASVSFADAQAVRDDQKLRAVLSSYLDSYDGAPLMAWGVEVRTIHAPGGECYNTGGVHVCESTGTGFGPWEVL